MRAVKLTDNVVTDIWEVPSLTCFEGVTLIPADDAQIGATYDGTKFTNPLYVDTRTYATRRAEEYPKIADQLDMIYHNGDGGVTFQAAIKAVKDKYPKE